jgi:uracil-DNA glycosylase
MAEETGLSAAQFLPEHLSLRSLQRAAEGCRGCPLHLNATQTVFGSGLVRSDVMVVGEQPGDREDIEGRPFVGPAGRVLDRGFELAGVPPDRVYVTNVVKHFKWEPRGKRRIHQRPSREEVDACRPWLLAEVEVIRPRIVVLLGATAAKSVFGGGFLVTRHRGQPTESELSPLTVATVHPSSVLRAGDDRDAAMDAFVDDLRVVAALLQEPD